MELRTEVEIDAPRERVWQVLMDFSAYSDWNPFITRISGAPEKGNSLVVTLRRSEGRESTFRPRVICYRPQKEFRWVGSLFTGWVFRGEHFFELQTLDFGDGDAERTRLIHGENFSGILVKFINRTLADTGRRFAEMNQALKERAEAMAHVH